MFTHVPLVHHGQHLASLAWALLHASAVGALWCRPTEASLTDQAASRDPYATFDARDWADLPAPHPIEPDP